MKKNFLLLIVILFGTQTINAQWLVNVGAAYGWGRQKSVLTTVNNQGLVETVNGSFGEGVELNLGVGRKFGDRFFYGVDFNYLTGRDFVMNDANPSTARDYNKTTFRGSGALIGPFLKFRVNPEGLSPYLRFTPQVAFMTLDEEKVRFIGDSATKDVFQYNYEAGFQFSINSAIGIEFMGGEMASFFIEVFNRNMVYNPSKRVNTKVPEGFQKEEDINYIDAPEQPNEQLAKSFDFSAIGFGFGVRIVLDSKPTKAIY